MLNVTSDLYGSSKILFYVASILKKRGYKVTLVLSYEGPLSNLFKKNGFEVEILRLGVLRKRYFNFFGLLNRVYVLVKSTYKLIGLCRKHEINLIYTNTTPVIIGAIVSKILKLDHVWHIHEIFEPPKSFIHKLFGFIINNSADRVLVVSSAVYENWINSLNKKNIRIIHNGIPIEEFSCCKSKLRDDLNIGPDVTLVAMIGRVNTYKGQSYYLEIASHLIKKKKNIKFLLVGDAFRGYEYLYDQLDQKIRDLNLSEYVIDLKFRDDIRDILNSIDLLILPSQKPDPFPTVILEAMASCKTVISTRQGGAIEQIEEGVTGEFIPLHNPVLAAEIIYDIISNPQLLKEYGLNGRIRLESYFTLQIFEKNINKIFDDFEIKNSLD